MAEQLDSGDIEILKLIQDNCQFTSREIASRTSLPITTVFAKIKRMERLGMVKGYHAVLDAVKLNVGTIAFISVSFAYRSEQERFLSQRKVAKQIADFPEVQEVHIVSGDWDILVKVRAKDVESVGKFVVDKLRLVKGIDKTLTCFVFETEKESTAIAL